MWECVKSKLGLPGVHIFAMPITMTENIMYNGSVDSEVHKKLLANLIKVARGRLPIKNTQQNFLEEQIIMKKLLAFILAAAMVFSLVACGGAESGEEAGSDVYKAVYLATGTLGDKSFHDSANAGLQQLKDELGADVFDFKVEQMGAAASDEAKYEPTLLDYCDSGEWDIIICGSWTMHDYVAAASADYPEQKFIFFDEIFDFEAAGNPENVLNILYKQNEVSYLVGAAAAMMTTDASIPGIDPATKKVGFLGGQDNKVINDFLAGFEQGAKDVDPAMEVVVSYVGSYEDSTKGKDLSLAQFQNGVDVGFNVAGNSGLGQIEAAKETGCYAFGVDADQAAILPDYAANIPSSALKSVGNSLYAAIKADMEGTLEFGTVEHLGFTEGGVALVKDAHYEEMIPAAIREKLDELEQKIIAGEIVVNTTY